MSTDEDIGKNIGAKGFEEEERDRAEQDLGTWGFFRIFWIGLAVVVLYVLSIGPVLRMYPLGVFNSPLYYVYWPVLRLWLDSPFGGVFYWYINDVWRCGVIIN
jgi:hypothetical protein